MEKTGKINVEETPSEFSGKPCTMVKNNCAIVNGEEDKAKAQEEKLDKIADAFNG